MKTMTGLACTLAIVLTSGEASAHSYHRVDRLAVTLERQSRDFMHQLAMHYRHTPQYAHLYRDAQQMVEVASLVHDIAHRGRNVDRLRFHVERLDGLFHHIEHQARLMRGCDMRYVNRSLREIGGTLHELRDEVNRVCVPVRQSPRRPDFGRRPHRGRPIARPQPVVVPQPVIVPARPQNTISYSKKGLRLSFGW